jgi:hypothetical protein
MPYAYWVAAIIDRTHHEHLKLLNQTVSIIDAADFVRLIGDRQFLKSWQSIRLDVDSEHTSSRQGKIILDGLWAMMMTGFAVSGYAYVLDKPMSKQLKATYVDICSRSSKNIYQVARDMNRPYSRVYADVKRLQEIGLVNALSSVQAGKRVTLLSAA